MIKSINKKGQAGIIIVFVILLLIVGIWGFIGGQEASSVGVTCDIGLGDTFCWKWHQNIIGQTGEAIRDLFG